MSPAYLLASSKSSSPLISMSVLALKLQTFLMPVLFALRARIIDVLASGPNQVCKVDVKPDGLCNSVVLETGTDHVCKSQVPGNRPELVCNFDNIDKCACACAVGGVLALLVLLRAPVLTVSSILSASTSLPNMASWRVPHETHDIILRCSWRARDVPKHAEWVPALIPNAVPAHTTPEARGGIPGGSAHPRVAFPSMPLGCQSSFWSRLPCEGCVAC